MLNIDCEMDEWRRQCREGDVVCPNKANMLPAKRHGLLRCK
jgi:hypothetical protein